MRLVVVSGVRALAVAGAALVAGAVLVVQEHESDRDGADGESPRVGPTKTTFSCAARSLVRRAAVVVTLVLCGRASQQGRAERSHKHGCACPARDEAI